MAPPKKTVKKMDLTSFLNDDTFGSSWAEEDVDLNKITIPIETANANTIPLSELAHAKNCHQSRLNACYCCCFQHIMQSIKALKVICIIVQNVIYCIRVWLFDAVKNIFGRCTPYSRHF